MNITDRECLIAHLSEIAAEAARLNLVGASVSVLVRSSHFDVEILSPFQTGPAAIRTLEVDAFGIGNRVIRSQVFEAYFGSVERTPTHRYTVFYDSSLDQAEPVIEQIFRHLAEIEQNLDACRVYEVAA